MKHTPGPTYSRSGVDLALKNRYEKILPSIRFTLPRLLKIPEFQRNNSEVATRRLARLENPYGDQWTDKNERLNREHAHVNEPRWRVLLHWDSTSSL
jgi:hypothetical protein